MISPIAGEGRNSVRAPYDLRHTAATLGIAAGVSVKVISDQLGHASISFTLERYSHVLPSIQDEAAAKVGKTSGSVSSCLRMRAKSCGVGEVGKHRLLNPRQFSLRSTTNKTNP